MEAPQLWHGSAEVSLLSQNVRCTHTPRHEGRRPEPGAGHGHAPSNLMLHLWSLLDHPSPSLKQAFRAHPDVLLMAAAGLGFGCAFQEGLIEGIQVFFLSLTASALIFSKQSMEGFSLTVINT